MSVKVSLVTISPRSHHRASLSRFDAVTIATDDGIAVVNNPVQAFFPADGGVTVQGQYGSGDTVRGNRIINGYSTNKSGALTIDFV